MPGSKKPEFAGKVGDRIRFKAESPLAGLVWEIRGVDKAGKLVIELENSIGASSRITADAANVGEILKDELPHGSIEPTGQEGATLGNNGSLPGGRG